MALPALPHRPSTAEYAAEVLRREIADGKLPPGTKLREEAVTAAFSVSRNTVREAFRLLAHERLVEHALHRGVYVRTVTPDDVRSLYRTRRLVQPLGAGPPGQDQERAVNVEHGLALRGGQVGQEVGHRLHPWGRNADRSQRGARQYSR